jgi:hypothetical protein
MSGERRDDGLWKTVATLPVVAIDETHAERVRAHCRRQLERHQHPASRTRNRANVVTVGKLWMWWLPNAWRTVVRMVSRGPQAGRPGIPVSGSARS